MEKYNPQVSYFFRPYKEQKDCPHQMEETRVLWKIHCCYLPRRKTTTFSGIITLLNEDYFPDSYRKYVFLNFMQSDQYRLYNDIVPLYLQGRLKQVIIHCLDQKANSAKFDRSDIVETDIQQGKFTVSGSKGRLYSLCFGDNSGTLPSCSCSDFTE